MVLPAPLKLKAALWDVMMGKSNGGSGNGGVVLLPPPKSMVFGLVLCRDKLVHMIRPHPHLVLRPQGRYTREKSKREREIESGM